MFSKSNDFALSCDPLDPGSVEVHSRGGFQEQHVQTMTACEERRLKEWGENEEFRFWLMHEKEKHRSKDVWNPTKNGINYLSMERAGFQSSRVWGFCRCFFEISGCV